MVESILGHILKMKHHRFYKHLKRTTQSIAPLDLLDKAITTFPTQLYEIEKLDAVNLSKNQIKSVPPTIKWLRTSEIKQLTLSNNGIDSVAYELANNFLIECIGAFI